MRTLKLGMVLVTTCLALPAYASTIDLVGDSSRVKTSGTDSGKGNSYRVDTNVKLLEFESFLEFTGSQELNFYVFENDAEYGNYDQIYIESQNVLGTGAAFYSSSFIDLELQSGNWYILAVSWSRHVTTEYFFGVADTQSTSFGAYVHGHPPGKHPFNTTILSVLNDEAVYYQRIHTVPIPEPSTAILATLSLTLLVSRRRR